MPATRLLIAEDEPIIRMLLVEVLADAGFDVTETDNADRAAELLGTHDFDILLTNINMPGKIDGIELATKARLIDASVPVMFISGRPDQLDRAELVGPPRAVIRKPFSLDEVVLRALRFTCDEART